MADWLFIGLFKSLLDGVLIGSLYALMAVGLTLVYRVAQVPNFAHAEYITYGAYAAFAVAAFLGGGIFGAVVFAALAGLLLAVASDELVFKPLWARGSSPLHLLVASIGVGLVLRYCLLAVAAASAGLLQISLPERPKILAVVFGATPITTVHVAAPALALSTAILLHLLLTKTRIGKAMRATASNPVLARISGINIYAVRRVTWAISGMLAGLAGFMYAYYIAVNPESGWIALLWMFAAAIVGGFTFYGAMLSGLLLGIAEHTLSFLAYQLFGVNTAYRPAIALIIMVLVLLFKPEGLIRLQSLSLSRRV